MGFSFGLSKRLFFRNFASPKKVGIIKGEVAELLEVAHEQN